ncbi:MAG TPA: BamA/TamA family outer membrane protein [Longimicrobiaceae bacterium]
MLRPKVRTALTIALAAFLLPSSLSAQYFGRNKVQYRKFDFRVLHTPNFDVYYYPEEEEATREAARMAERWYARLSRLLDHEFEQRQPLILYASHPDFQQTNTLMDFVSEGTGGFTEVFKQRVVLPFSYSLEETDHVLGHELVHAFQYDISGLGRAGGGLEAAARRYQVPLWFTEGMAEYLSVGPIDPHTAMWVRDAALRGDIPDIERMTYDPTVFPYRWGQALWAYIGGRWGDATIGQILKLAGQGLPYEEAFERVLRISMRQLSDDWVSSIRRTYLPMIADLREAREMAHPLITSNRVGGRLNVAPSLSPDGRFVAFISDLDFIDAELHLADASTGRVIRTLQKSTALDSHYGSLRYINSAGTWSPDSRYFAFSALKEGRDVLVIVDTRNARKVREFAVPGVGEISNPTWSPDGRTIAFSGLKGGISDLYLIDLEAGSTAQLTDDPYAQLHPAYSPDGSTIAFVTEKGPSTDFGTLRYGPYHIALLDVETRTTTPVPGMAGAKNINPVWSKDGRSLFFISNRGGIPNLYRVDLEGGDVYRLTNFFTGISGIIDVSPALTGARERDKLLFTVYENGGYNIYALDGWDALAGVKVPSAPDSLEKFAAFNAALLPPSPRSDEATFNRVSSYLADATYGLPNAERQARFTETSYKPRLGLDYLGQPQLGVSVGGPFGSGMYGGVAGIFSDVLGRHTLFGMVQAQGRVDEIGFATQYLNRRERWNYGGQAQRLPYIFGFYAVGTDSLDGAVVPTQDIVRVRQFDTALQGYAQYPFSTAQRIEFSAGVRRIATDAQVYRLLLDPQTYRPRADRYFEEDGFALNMAQMSIALVYDNAVFNYTSPFAGQRYRLQITPMVGDLQMVQALADYRRYLFVQPFTLAVQLLHTGKYGQDSDGVIDGQRIFYDQYLGQPWYVRGYYDVYSDCKRRQSDADACTVFPQLFGSRVAVAKAEIRFPLVKRLLLGSVMALPPIEGFGFFDAGTAWNQDTRPSLQRGVPEEPGARGIMTSAGAGARVNFFGYLVVEINYLRAFALDDGWKWAFNFLPGF